MRISLIPQLICCTVLITPPMMLPTRAAMPPTIHFLTTFHQFACLSASFLITQFCLLSNFYQHSAPMSIFVHMCIPICWLPLTLCPPNAFGLPSPTLHLFPLDHHWSFAATLPVICLLRCSLGHPLPMHTPVRITSPNSTIPFPVDYHRQPVHPRLGSH